MSEQLERIDGMGDARLVTTGQTAAVAAAAREASEWRGQLVLAREFPRDEAKAREGALESCARPEFAMKEDGTPKAIYAYKRGSSTVSGPGVVLARELARRWGNLRFGIEELPEEDPSMVHLRATATDCETNVRVIHEDRFSKRIQRKGQGWIEPDERDLRELKNRRGAFLARNCLLQLLPPDLVDAAVARVRETMALAAGGELVKDRKGTVLKITAAFSKLGVVRGQLDTFIGGNLDEVTPEQLADLKGAYTSIADGAASVAALFPPAESEGVTALRARIAELEAKASADPFAGAAVEQAPAKAEPEPEAKPLTDQQKASLREQLRLGDERAAAQRSAPTPTPAISRQPGDDDFSDDVPQTAPDAPGSTNGTEEQSIPLPDAAPAAAPRTKLELQAAVKGAEAKLGRDRAKALREAHQIEGLSIATAPELAAYLAALEAETAAV